MVEGLSCFAMAEKDSRQGYTGSGSIHGFDQVLWRLFFAVELAVSAAIVFGVWVGVLGRRLIDAWPAVLFCYSCVLAIIMDFVVKKWVLRRRPLFSPVFGIIVIILMAGIGYWLASLMAR